MKSRSKLRWWELRIRGVVVRENLPDDLLDAIAKYETPDMGGDHLVVEEPTVPEAGYRTIGASRSLRLVAARPVRSPIRYPMLIEELRLWREDHRAVRYEAGGTQVLRRALLAGIPGLMFTVYWLFRFGPKWALMMTVCSLVAMTFAFLKDRYRLRMAIENLIDAHVERELDQSGLRTTHGSTSASVRIAQDPALAAGMRTDEEETDEPDERSRGRSPLT